MHAPKPLTGEELSELLDLLRGADTAELKLTVPESERYAALQALEVDPLDARMRQVFFFDTPDLALNAAGVVVRARRIQDAIADTVVKLRPVLSRRSAGRAAEGSVVRRRGGRVARRVRLLGVVQRPEHQRRREGSRHR